MYESRGGEVMWDKVALALLIVIVLMIMGWYLESRFGSMVTVMTFGALFAITLILIGFKLAANNTKHTLDVTADFLHEIQTNSKSELGLFREYAKADSHALKRQADLEFMNAKRVDQLAQQRAKMLTNVQVSTPDDDIWEDDPDISDSAGFQVYD